MIRPKWLGWILWKAKIAIKIVDDVKFLGFSFTPTGIEPNYIYNDYHYEFYISSGPTTPEPKDN